MKIKTKKCINCGRTLPENWKNKECESCLGKKANKLKKIGKGIAGTAMTLFSLVALFATKGKFGGKSKM